MRPLCEILPLIGLIALSVNHASYEIANFQRPTTVMTSIDSFDRKQQKGGLVSRAVDLWIELVSYDDSAEFTIATRISWSTELKLFRLIHLLSIVVCSLHSPPALIHLPLTMARPAVNLRSTHQVDCFIT